MHVRFSTCRGMPILERGSEQLLGLLDEPLIHPDTGKIEGFFVRVPHFLRTEILFLSSMDIAHWGTYLRVLDRDVLAPLEEHFRLHALYESNRHFLGQRILTDTGRSIGRCFDLQFDTKILQIEWLFPRRLFRWGIAVPGTEIIEVRSDAIVVRDPAAPVTDPPDGGSLIKSLEGLTDAGMPRPSVRI